MNTTMLIIYLAIQLIVQYMFYVPVRNTLFKIHSKYVKTIPWIGFEFFIVNLLVSIVVLLFTGRGGLTGMTNTFASVLLGIIMYVDYKMYYRDIISGWYYKKEQKAKEIRARQKEILDKLSKQNKHYYEM